MRSIEFVLRTWQICGVWGSIIFFAAESFEKKNWNQQSIRLRLYRQPSRLCNSPTRLRSSASGCTQPNERVCSSSRARRRKSRTVWKPVGTNATSRLDRRDRWSRFSYTVPNRDLFLRTLRWKNIYLFALSVLGQSVLSTNGDVNLMKSAERQINTNRGKMNQLMKDDTIIR